MKNESLSAPVADRKLKCLQITTIDLTAYCFYLNWFSFLIENGFEVTLATTVQSFRKEIESTGTKVVNIPMARNINPPADLRSLLHLYDFIKKEKFDIVQTYTTKAGFLGRLAAKMARVPVIIHNMLEPPHNAAGNIITKTIFIQMEKLASNWAHHIFTTTSPNVKEILDKKLVAEEKLTAIPEGLMIDKYSNIDVNVNIKREELNISLNNFLAVTVARLETPKGHTYLLDAAAEILKQRPEMRFICVGRGNLESSLKDKAKKLGIADSFLFLGFRDDMLEILKCADLFVLPSLWEGQGVAIMEAMAMKKGVVACRVGGVVDVVEEGITGILVPPRNPRALKDAILLMAGDPGKVKTMGEAGYKRIVEKFDENAFNRKRLKTVMDLVEKRIFSQ